MGNQYSYEDHKDGTHCVYKTACVTKYTTISAFTLASLDVINISKPSNIGGALVRYPRYMVPGVMTGVAFGLTTCTLAMIRRKDDHLNYIFGGLAAGTVIGACRRSIGIGIPTSIILAFFCGCYKELRMNNVVFFPRVINTMGSWDSMAADYTITPDRPKYTIDRPSFVE